LNRGLFVLAASLAAVLLGAASAVGSKPAQPSLVELVVLLQKPSAATATGDSRGPYLASLARGQDAFASRLARAVPRARVRWRYEVVLDGLAVVAPAGSARLIAALPGVASVTPSVSYGRTLFSSPAVIGAPQIWGPTLSTAGEGMKIGIIDDGIDQTHPFFSPSGFAMPAGFPKGNRAYTTAKVIVARSFPPPDLHNRYGKLPFDPSPGGSEHGTHVAGIAAGDHGTTAPGPNGPVQVSGIAPLAYLGNYRVLTIPTDQVGLDGNSPEIVAGIEAAVRDGMNVINLSLGEPDMTPSRDIVVQALNGAAQVGVVPVVAAGNEFDSLGYGTIDSPGSAARAITVGAATKGGAMAIFSSSGPTPYSLSLKPDVTAPGVSILSSVPRHFGTWAEFDGTSMATPHVAGAAALLLQRHPSWSVADVKSALVLTGKPVTGHAGEVPPTREGGGMIWLPKADDPLVFASPTNFSLGYLRRGRAATRRIHLADAGGGAGSWNVTLHPSAAGGGVTLTAPLSLSVPGTLTLRASASRGAASADSSGFAVLTRGADVRRVAYWVHVSARALSREPHVLLHGTGIYHGNTKRGRSLVSSYRYPSNPSAIGIRGRLPGPEQVFRFVLRRPAVNAGAVVTSRAGGVHVSPRLVRAGDEDRLTGNPGLPFNVNPYENGFYGLVPAVGVFRPLAGAYDLVFDTPSRRSAGAFTFRFWIDDTTPPSARLLTRIVSPGQALRVLVRDRGSGVDPQSLLARVGGRSPGILYRPSTGIVSLVVGRLAPGPHRLLFSVADYQETKNNEDAAKTLPNTRVISVGFVVR
jgi:subtilisin family serine protease